MLIVCRSSQLHLKEIAACHRECFPDSLSTQLHIAYTIKSFEWFLAGENRFLFHASINDKIVGYCGGFISQYIGDGSTSGMLQYAMKQAITGIIKKPWLLLNKELIYFYPLIFRNIYHKIFSKKQKYNPASQPSIEKRLGLVVIGVHPLFRGKNVFKKLMESFENEAFQRSVSKLILSVKKDNTKAVCAYENVGWRIVDERANELKMQKKLPLKND